MIYYELDACVRMAMRLNRAHDQMKSSMPFVNVFKSQNIRALSLRRGFEQELSVRGLVEDAIPCREQVE